jgi:regulator of RNase E activity RraA
MRWNVTLVKSIACAAVLLTAAPVATAPGEAELAALRAGKNFLATTAYSAEADKEILKRFEGLRVADVSDGMDAVGLQNIGRMDPAIHPLWRDIKHFTHRFAGIAVTTRYVPTNRPPAGKRSVEEFDRWKGNWYGTIAPEAFAPLIRPGTALVIDNPRSVDVGPIGSNNSMSWRARGCAGVVANATARDTDELCGQGLPIYFRKTGRGIRPGRIELESVNRPVVVGGVLVMPGDVIVADGDGVIVVPRRHAEAVAAYARTVMDGDKAGRRALYEKLGLPEDDSVR